MALVNPFFSFIPNGGDNTFEDDFGFEDFQFVPSVDFTSGVLQTIPESQGGGLSRGAGLFNSVKGILGFANTGIDLLDGLDLQARRLTGDGFLPDDRLISSRANAGGLGGGTLVLFGLGAVALVLLLRK